MNFADAVRSVLTQYATFRGRARRSEYWWFYLFSVLVSIATSVVDQVIGSEVELVSTVASLALIVPTLAVTVRRLHDTGRSAWWLLVVFLPVVVGVGLVVAGLLTALGNDDPSVGLIVVGGLLTLAGAVVNIVLMCLPSTAGDNRYGPSPLGPPPGSPDPYGGPYGQQPYGGPGRTD